MRQKYQVVALWLEHLNLGLEGSNQTVKSSPCILRQLLTQSSLNTVQAKPSCTTSTRPKTRNTENTFQCAVGKKQGK